MTASFTCTYDDFVEAHKIHRRPARSQRSGLGERLLFVWILLGTIGALITIAIVEYVAGVVGGTAPMIELQVTEWAVAIAWPWVPWLLVNAFLWFAMAGMVGPNERRPARQMLLWIAAVHFINTTVVLILSGGPEAQRAREAAAATQPVNDLPLIATLLPWVTILFVIWIFVFRYVRGMLPRHWEAQPQLRLPQTVTQTERGLRFEDERTAHDYTWAAFRKFREGERLFLLYVSDVSFQMVPKRALTEPGQVEAFRQLLEQHVPSDGPVAARFPMRVAAA